MSPEKEKGSNLSKELQALHECCLADGLTQAEIRHVARAFLSTCGPKKRSLPRRRMVKKGIACAAALLCLLLLRESIEWRLCMWGRLLMIAVCEDLSGAAREDGVQPQALLEDYIDNLVPVVVKESISDWPSAVTSFALTNITQAYLEDEVLKAAAICNFRSNRRLGFDAFLRSLHTSSGWFAHWENCDRPGQKHLRQFYRRPSFLPLAVELTRPNWVIASRGFSGRRFKQLDFEPGSTLIWLAQVKGLTYVRLVPEAICLGICQEQELLLDARDILLVQTKLWKVQYLPGEDSENIAFAAGGFISE